MTDILQQKWKPSPDAVSTGVGQETVVLQVNTGTYYGLNELGTRVWEGLNQGRSPADICADIAAEHDVPLATVEADARNFLAALKENEIILVE